MQSRQVVVALLIAASFLSCQSREREKIMDEIGRLDLLRETEWYCKDRKNGIELLTHLSL